MPRAILVYRLPDEEVEYRAAVQGAAAKSCLWEIDQRLRGLLKHGNPSEETRRLAEEIRGMIRESPERLLED